MRAVLAATCAVAVAVVLAPVAQAVEVPCQSRRDFGQAMADFRPEDPRLNPERVIRNVATGPACQ